VFFLVLVEERLEVLVHRVQECIYFFQTSPRQGLDLADSVVDHRCQFLPLVRTLFRGQVELVKDDLAYFDDLFVCQFEILVSHRHAEV
jgi:hypothetical protein